ncbi:MAG: SGNH/GDSL hydrolase family protein [Terracidiphilus sp.]
MRLALKIAACSLLAARLCGLAALPVARAQAGPAWVASWGASQQIPEPQNELPADGLRDATLRQIVHLSAGGAGLRVHLSNAFGAEPLRLTAVHVARPLSPSTPAIDPASDRALTFAGRAEVTIPPGAEIVSDALGLAVAPLSDLAVSIHFDALPAPQTGHPGSRAASYLAPGNQVSAVELVDPKRIDHWYQLSAVDVAAGKRAAAVVVLGDSITDGHGATANGNDRWTDVLARRLQAEMKTRRIGVVNAGIGGNHLLTDGLGPNVLARFDRDVLAPAGVRWVIVFEGVNDLGGLALAGEQPPAAHAALVERVIAAYRQIAVRAHAHGLRVLGATITPYTGSEYYHPGAAEEADRQAVNAWIRGAGDFDAVLDFDQAVRDLAHPERLLPAYDCGDHLHPSPTGYKAIGESVPLALFAR